MFFLILGIFWRSYFYCLFANLLVYVRVKLYLCNIIKYNRTMTNLLLLLPSGSEWIIIAVIFLLLFGGKKIPELMKGLGKGVKSFKDGVNEAKEEINKAQEELDEPASKK